MILVTALGIAGVVVIRRAGPILRARIEETLSARFHGRVELGGLAVALFPHLEVSGDSLRIYAPGATGASQPLIRLDHFSFEAGLIGLFFEPMHVRVVQVTGLQIDIPPLEMRRQTFGKPGKRVGKIKILVDEIICDQSRLIIGTARPNKDPLDFELKHIDLHDIGPGAPWRYHAAITNAVPRGEINAAGFFGPWQTDNPGDTSVSGHYRFDHADLNPINGIGGILSSVGAFKGQLDKIVVDGKTETPDFSLDSANHPLPLNTRFHAVVDGITGDTYLDPVEANLRNTRFTTRGSVTNVKGRGHTIELDVDVPDGQIQDFLDLAVKTEPAILTGRISLRTKLRIPPGKQRIVEKLRLNGNFTLQKIHFTNPKVQDKVDAMSLRAQGKPKKAKPRREDVVSRMNGSFSLNRGLIRLSHLTYVLPGARVNLTGIYSLDGQRFDLRGKIRTQASLSHLAGSPWLSLLLKIASPFFDRGGGAEIPVRITGTESEPKFGLNLF